MDAISAMRMTAAGRITPFNPPVLEQGQAGQIGPVKIPMDEVKNLGNIGPAQLPNLGPQSSAPLSGVFDSSGGRTFSDFLGEMVRDVNAKQATANQAVQGVLDGENVPLHQAMLSVEEASVSFQLMVEVRNKLLDSYQELMRMQI
jgi:flagellar hook-basal body complex protein FliE